MNTNNTARPNRVDSQLFPFESKWLTVDGHRIHYVDEGPRDTPILLFVHPGAGWSFTYRYQIRQLRDQFRCVAPDLPGYGLSEAAKGYDYTLLEQSRALERFVETLNLNDLIVWANDGGGPTAVLALAKHANRVRGLVVGGTFGWSLKPYSKVTRPLHLVTGGAFRVINRYTNLLAWSMGSKMAIGTRSLPKEERRQYTAPFKDRKTRDHTLKLFRSFLDPRTQEELDRALPAFHDKAVLIQFGDKDVTTGQRWPERWAESIPDHRLHILPGVAHMTFEGAPEATVENFREWWAEMKQRDSLASSTGQASPYVHQVLSLARQIRNDQHRPDPGSQSDLLRPPSKPIINSLLRLRVPMGNVLLLTRGPRNQLTTRSGQSLQPAPSFMPSRQSVQR